MNVSTKRTWYVIATVFLFILLLPLIAIAPEWCETGSLTISIIFKKYFDALTPIATCVGVFVALFQSTIIGWINRPKLEMSLVSKDGDLVTIYNFTKVHTDGSEEIGGVKSVYYLAHIDVGHGITLKNCTVYLHKFGVNNRRPWVGNLPLSWRHHEVKPTLERNITSFAQVELFRFDPKGYSILGQTTPSDLEAFKRLIFDAPEKIEMEISIVAEGYHSPIFIYTFELKQEWKEKLEQLEKPKWFNIFSQNKCFDGRVAEKAQDTKK